jgi:putative ABC transport system substrate-binding protein
MLEHIVMSKKLLITLTSIAVLVTAIIFLSPSNNQESTSLQAKNKIIAIATFVDHVVLNSIRDGFLEQMRVKGYTKGNRWNMVVFNANGSPQEAAGIANEVLNLNPEIVVSFSTPATKPVFEKNNGRYPLVFSFVSFPEKIGISEDSPNVTGLSDGVDFNALILLVKEAMPSVSRIGMVYSDEPNAVASHEQVQQFLKEHGVSLVSQSVSKEEEVRSATEALLGLPLDKRPQAIIVGADGVVTNKITALLDIANNSGIPVFAVDESSVEKGALAGLSIEYTQFGRETANVVDQVLSGTSPDSIPLIRYLANDILINTDTAAKLNIAIPDALKAKAIKIFQKKIEG